MYTKETPDTCNADVVLNTKEELNLDISFSKSLNLNEDLRAIKRKLLLEAFGGDGRNKNRVMVTSIHEKEGKTFCALNLARSIALEKNKHVLLVDTNVVNSSLSRMVKTSDGEDVLGSGLIDYLNNPEIGVPSLIRKVENESLKIITVGKENQLANELLCGHVMLDLLDEFRDRYSDRLVIFDAPPLNGVNEAMNLSQSVDQIIIVIENGRVKSKEILHIKKLLPAGVRVHFLLNKALDVKKWKRGN